MDFLHAYWRMEYIEAPKEDKSEDNLFELLPLAKNDKDVYILSRSEHCYTVLNKFPYNAGHLLVVPFKPGQALSDLSKEARVDLMESIVENQRILTCALKPDGFNVGFNFGSAAGAGLPKHLHCHIVPRWYGDTNFMPVIGATKVLPTALESIWERLRQFVNS